MVQCKRNGRVVYTNTHALCRNRPDLRKRITTFANQTKRRPLSVLMMGIDSISRLNLIRSMPFTAQHLYDTGWFELQGYNKVMTLSKGK